MNNHNTLEELREKLFETARRIQKRAYVPYSSFRVGAAIWADNNEVFSGCNVENISYPCGTCAEAGAIASMNAGGCKKIREILITADGQSLITPCGACLQRIKEFSDENTLIHLSDKTGIKQTLTIKDLLPLAFDDEELHK